MKNNYIDSLITLAGVIGFVVIVTYLHFAQAGYDPVHQFMSELALGRHGFLMLWAFMSFALAVAGSIIILAAYGVHPVIKMLLGMASLSLAGAGIFKLGADTTLHISLVALAFFLVVLSMYLIPRTTAAFQKPLIATFCWGLGAGTALCVGLGQGPLPIGIAQRLAAACILLWLVWLAVFHLTQKTRIKALRDTFVVEAPLNANRNTGKG